MDPLSTAANWFGAALCHQWDSHSYIINNIPLCLCARCTGMYLGALLTFVYLRFRVKGGAGMPRLPYLFAFLVFFALWAGDGFNSYLTTLQQSPFLYQPQHLFRLSTGMLVGIAVGSLLFIVLSGVEANDPTGSKSPPLYSRARDFWILLGIGAVLVALVNTEWSWLYYPVSLALLAAMLLLPTVMVLILLVSVLETGVRPGTIRQYAPLALALTIVFLSLISGARMMSGINFEPPI